MLPIDPKQLELARLELRAMVRNYLFSPDYDINLIDFGFPRRTNPTNGQRYWDVERVSLRFHVAKKYTLEQLDTLQLKRLPRKIGQFATDVIEAEYTVPLPTNIPYGPRATRRDKLCGGLGISAYRDMYGTLGGIVRDRQTGALMILSNWHVLYATRNARAGLPTYQPILRSAGAQSSVVARLAGERLSAPGATAFPLDVAVARLLDQQNWENHQLEIGKVTGVTQARLGMKLVKSGLMSGKTYGVVSGVEGFIRMAYEGNWRRMIERVVTISRWPLDNSFTLVSQGGDSGSWWLDEATNKAIALHFAGLRDGTRAQAMDMQYVLDAMNVEIADTGA